MCVCVFMGRLRADEEKDCLELDCASYKSEIAELKLALSNEKNGVYNDYSTSLTS